MTDTADDTTAAVDPPAPEVMHGCPVADSLGQTVVFPSMDEYMTLVKALADEGYTVCIDLTDVDYLDFMGRPLPEGIVAEQFEIVVNLLDITNRRRIRVRLQVPADEPTVPTLFDLYPGTEAMEREVYDMFGVVFTDHPDLSRILMPEDWIGHPLRKDYDVGKIPVQFKGANS